MNNSTLKPLKMPSQKRSWATYNALLEATTYILIEQGYEGLTTNHVAERAGVNIASLYQYFPNKDALVATLHINHAQQARKTVDTILKNAGDCSTATLIERFVNAIVDIHLEQPELHRIFQENMPRLLKTSLLEEGNDQFLETIELMTKQTNLPNIAPKDLAWMIRIMTHSIIHQAIVDRRDDLLSCQLKSALTTMLHKILL